nr:heparan sulfate glucosamine 3-O-sulfotransferase 1-like [Lytechinus pictus]
MKYKLPVVCLSVTFVVTLSVFGGSMISPAFFIKYREPQSARTPSRGPIANSHKFVGDADQGFARGKNIVLGVKWKRPITIVNRKNADNFKALESIETILGRINTTDPTWTKKVDNCFIYGEKRLPVRKNLLQKRRCQNRLPVALVLGVKKCGTGTLSRFLDLHPAVSMTSETSFPGKRITKSSVINWIQLMRLSSPYQLTMTENPSFFESNLPSDLKPYLSSSVKFFVILRNPVDRAISDYLHTVAHSNAPKDRPFDIVFNTVRVRETFEKTVLGPDGYIVPSTMTELGQYVVYLNKFRKVYHRDQFLFIDGDAFAKDPYPTLLKVEEFLGLPKFYKRTHFVKNQTKGLYCAQVPERPDFGCMIPSKGRPHPKVSEDILRKLRDYYRPYNKKLRDQLGLNFSWTSE